MGCDSGGVLWVCLLVQECTGHSARAELERSQIASMRAGHEPTPKQLEKKPSCLYAVL